MRSVLESLTNLARSGRIGACASVDLCAHANPRQRFGAQGAVVRSESVAFEVRTFCTFALVLCPPSVRHYVELRQMAAMRQVQHFSAFNVNGAKVGAAGLTVAPPDSPSLGQGRSRGVSFTAVPIPLAHGARAKAYRRMLPRRRGPDHDDSEPGRWGAGEWRHTARPSRRGPPGGGARRRAQLPGPCAARLNGQLHFARSPDSPNFGGVPSRGPGVRAW